MMFTLISERGNSIQCNVYKNNSIQLASYDGDLPPARHQSLTDNLIKTTVSSGQRQSHQSTGFQFNNQKLDWNCVCVLLCCHSHHRCSWSPQNFAPVRPGTLLLLLGQHGYWTASPPAQGALLQQSAANGGHPSSSPVQKSSGMRKGH